MTTLTQSKHDLFFKRMMADLNLANDFFTAHLPVTVAEKIQLHTLQIESGNLVDEAMQERETDMLYSVRLINEEKAYLFLLVEHQRKSDPFMPFRLHNYVMKILDRYVRETNEQLPLPFVYPMVFYNGIVPYQDTRDLFDLFGENADLARDVFLKPFRLIDVSTISDEEFRAHQWAGIMEWCMRHARTKNILETLDTLRGLLEQLNYTTHTKSIKTMLQYLLKVADFENGQAKTAIDKLLQGLPKTLENDIMNVAEALRQEGEAKGEQKIFDAISLLKQGESLEKVHNKTGVSIDKLRQLKNFSIH